MKNSQANTNNKKSPARAIVSLSSSDYGRLVGDISTLLEQARKSAARSVNAFADGHLLANRTTNRRI